MKAASHLAMIDRLDARACRLALRDIAEDPWPWEWAEGRMAALRRRITALEENERLPEPD